MNRPNNLARPRYGLDTISPSFFDDETIGGDIVSHIRTILPQLDMTRPHIVYVRKSNPRAEAENANYLRYQEGLAAYIIEAGVSEPLVQALSEDIGISAIYDSTFRPSLRQIEEALLSPAAIGTIWIADVARIYRDPTAVGPTVLAQKLANNAVKIVHFESGRPEVIDMASRAGHDYFLDGCRAAARQRDRTRAVTLTARQEAFKAGEWSGSPLPVGWILDPPTTELVKGRRVAIAARVRRYEPHAKIKKHIMTIGMAPEIKTWSLLLRTVNEECLEITPFPENLREYMATRSALKNCVRQGQVYNPDEPAKITKTMLYNLLLDPLAMGYVLFGSGARVGGKEWANLTRKYGQMRFGAVEGIAKPDSLVRDYREFGRMDAELAILDANSAEDQELFWGLYEKWSEFDADELRESNFQKWVKKEERRRGRPEGSGTAHHWVSRLICGLHNDDDHLLSYHPGTRPDRKHATPRWVCWRDKRMNGDDWCITVGSEGGMDLLTRVLDPYFLTMVRGVLERLSDEEDDKKTNKRTQQIEALQNQIEGFQKRLTRKRRQLDDSEERWEADNWSDEEQTTERRRFTEDEIRPVERALHEARKHLAILMDSESPSNAANLNAREMLSIVDRVQADWPTFTVATRQVLIDTFIDSVRVYADSTPASDEIWLEVLWKAGRVDTLLLWSNPALDKREWTADENASLRNLWPSDCSWEEISDSLQRGRRYNLVRRQAASLGIKDAARSRKWREQADISSKSYWQLNPTVLYWQRRNEGWIEVFTDGTQTAHKNLPANVILPTGLESRLQVANKEGAFVAPFRAHQSVGDHQRNAPTGAGGGKPRV